MRLGLKIAVVCLVAPGCEDATGLGASCAAEMSEVRRAEGQPDHANQTRVGGDFVEQWVYDAGGGRPGRYYSFRWGISYTSCEIEGPSSLNMIAEEDGPSFIWFAGEPF